MEDLFFVVHNKNSASTYSEMKNISWINIQKIYEGKRLREEIRSDNYHEEQCLLLPSEIIDLKHGINLNPCYKKFMEILSNKQFKRKQVDESDLESPTRPKRLWLGVKEKNMCIRKNVIYVKSTASSEKADHIFQL